MRAKVALRSAACTTVSLEEVLAPSVVVVVPGVVVVDGAAAVVDGAAATVVGVVAAGCRARRCP